MFAVLFHESMNPFYQTVASFPTVIYTVLLGLCVVYWAVAALGLIDLELLDFDMDGDIDLDDSLDAQNSIAGLLMKLGLNGVPFMVVLTILTIIAWAFSYYVCLFAKKLLPDLILIQLIFNIIVFFIVLIISTLLTAQIIKPLRTLFKKFDIDETKHIIGQTIIVRSAIVNKDRGEAFMDDGGAGLLLHIRATGDDEFVKGDEVIVIEQNKEKNLFRVVSKSEFSD